MNHVRSLMLSLFAVVVLFFAPRTYAQCFSGCPTTDEIALQQQLDATAAAGGGVVQLEARTYNICSPLIVGSNTHVRGAGRGATIIRGSARDVGKFIDGSFVGASLAAIGAKNVVISDLTIDNASCERNSNGISFLPKSLPGEGSQEYNGDPVENSSIERVEILGAPQFHSYLIWNLKGRHNKIVGNWLNGRATATSAQEGIESFGGHDVLISGNTVQNIGGACVNIGSAGMRNSELFGVTASDNHLSNCTIGVNIGTSLAGADPQNNLHTHVSGNVINNMRQFGIDVAVIAGSLESDLIITNNSISDLDGNLVAGIRLRSMTEEAISSDAVMTNTISDNHIQNIRGANAHGIRVLAYPHARLIGNSIHGVENAGIYAQDSDDLEIIGNRIENVDSSPMVLSSTSSDGFARFIIERNTIRNWKRLTSGILVLTGKRGVIKDNIFSRDDFATPTPATAAAKSCSVVSSGNVAWYDLDWPGVFVQRCQ